MSQDSEWPYLYPFLLAHGVVPLPPFDLPGVAPKIVNRRGLRDPLDIKGREANFKFALNEKTPLSVAISHDANGLI